MSSAEPSSPASNVSPAKAPPTRAPWRLWHLFLITTVIATEMALLRASGVLAACGVVFWLAVWLWTTRRQKRVPGVRSAITLGVMTITVLIAAPVQLWQYEQARRSNLSRSELWIAHAGLASYYEIHRRLPEPATVRDGVPWRSWRIDVLPFIEFEHLHSRYDFDKGWDAPSHVPATFSLINPYRTPLGSSKPTTRIVALLDEQGRWRSGFAEHFGRRFGPSRDPWPAAAVDVANPVVLLQLPEPGVPWTAPLDAGPGSASLLGLEGYLSADDLLFVMHADQTCREISLRELRSIAPHLWRPVAP